MARDPGGLNYKQHNIFTNFVRTYRRLPAETPITIHQKAFFLFWLSCIAITLFLKVKKYMKGGSSKSTGKSKDAEEESLIRDRNDNNNGLTLGDVIQIGKIKDGDDPQIVQANQSNDPENRTDNAVTVMKPSAVTKPIKTESKPVTFEQFVRRMTIMGCIMFYFWLCDYLRMWPVAHKTYSRDLFVFLLFLLAFVAFLFSVKKTQDKPLNRDQTEEWKGWMQVQFIWYHYFDALETYNYQRVYVGTYVWLTGFGNYMYFSKQKDFSLHRLLKMLFRLNFLVFCVIVTNNLPYARYYVCAMHTYWFLSIWAVMAIYSKYNENPKFMLLKFFIYFICNLIIFDVPGVFKNAFYPFSLLLNVNGELNFWQYRSSMDHWSALIGMICGFAFTHYERFLKYLERNEPYSETFRKLLRILITSISLIVLYFWYTTVLVKPQKEYLKIHPVTSFIPALIYIWLRNQNSFLRTNFLNVFAWLGKITLETYLSNIHINMVANATNILVYLPNYPLLNFVVSTLVYVGISYVLFKLTVFFSGYLLPSNMKTVSRNAMYGAAWIFGCYVVAFSLTKANIWGSTESGLDFLRWRIG